MKHTRTHNKKYTNKYIKKKIRIKEYKKIINYIITFYLLYIVCLSLNNIYRYIYGENHISPRQRQDTYLLKKLRKKINNDS